MDHFQTLGHNIDVILACPDEDLQRLGILEQVQALRETISEPGWGAFEIIIAVLADTITRKEQKDEN